MRTVDELLTNRRELLSRIAHGFIVGGLIPTAFGADPWTESELIRPADLAKQIEAGTAPPIICVAFPFLYRQRHIRGAKYAGPGNMRIPTKEIGYSDLMSITIGAQQSWAVSC